MIISSVSPQTELTNTPPHWIPENFTLFRFEALIFTASQAKTITVTVTEFSTQFGVDYGLMTTDGVIGSIPPSFWHFCFSAISSPG